MKLYAINQTARLRKARNAKQIVTENVSASMFYQVFLFSILNQRELTSFLSLLLQVIVPTVFCSDDKR